MLKQIFPILLIPVILLGAGCSQIDPVVVEEETVMDTRTEVEFADGLYTLDIVNSTIAWNAQKRVGAKHHGTVAAQEGAFVAEQGQIVGGTIFVDMNTIADLDLTDEKFNTMLVNHLKSEDFFAIETYPSATFTISSVTKIDAGTYDVTGNMTMKGKEQEISFPAIFVNTETGMQVTGTATLDRTLWDVRFGSDKFFDNLGDGLIEDEFTLTFDLMFLVP